MISREEVLNLANLSKLYLNEEEIENIRKEMDSMINFANEINNLDVKYDKLPEINNISNAFREDEVVESYPQEEILKNVGGGREGFFYIKKSN
ncbi:MAG: Asp-tRNA(Asn)/Glu-tRNA(Gln) amidotransferase subunit GatC [Clostridia bacterium]|nr:Asp-tRNA(Asn)/Glu-tRNA(Gln) amidotransferase subunit GatC [Clostridia bacterium]